MKLDKTNHGVKRMLERTQVKRLKAIRKAAINHMVACYKSINTGRIAIRFVLEANKKARKVVIFSGDGHLVTILDDDMFTLAQRVKYQFKIHKLTTFERIMIKYGITGEDPELVRLRVESERNIKGPSNKGNIYFSYKSPGNQNFY